MRTGLEGESSDGYKDPAEQPGYQELAVWADGHLFDLTHQIGLAVSGEPMELELVVRALRAAFMRGFALGSKEVGITDFTNREQ